jgi:hypothetical protein
MASGYQMIHERFGPTKRRFIFGSILQYINAELYGKDPPANDLSGSGRVLRAESLTGNEDRSLRWERS